MSGLLGNLKEAVRNSPLVARKSNNYAMAMADDSDPFNRGLYFHVEYMGVEALPKALAQKGAELSTSAVERVNERVKPPYRKFSVLVTDKSLRLKDMATKQVVDDVPLYSISYCGTHSRYDRTFCFIARDADTQDMRVQVMRAGDRGRAQAMIVTVSKAFNIAYMAWQAQQKQTRSKDILPGMDSPRAQRRIQQLQEKAEKRKSQEATSIEVSAAAVTSKLAKSSLATGGGGAPVPAEVTSNHDDDLDAMFTELAASRSNPDLLENDIDAKPEGFSWDDTKEFVDPNSTPNLLD